MGDALLKLYASHSRLFLAPSIPHKVIRTTSTPSDLALASLSIFRRPFVTNRTLRQESSGTAAASPKSDPNVANFRAATPITPPNQIADKKKSFNDLSSGLLDDTMKGNFRPRRVSDTIPGGGSVAAKLPSSLAAFNDSYSSSGFSTRNRQGLIANDMMGTNTGTERRLTRSRAVRTIKSNPKVGRTVEIINSRESKVKELGSALKVLAILCRVNKVRKDQRAQLFYERPGLRRKRLRRERWRERFHNGFQKMVLKVKAMTKQGW